jgi:hypothetical protein
LNLNKFRVWTKFEFEQISNWNKNSKYEQVLNLEKKFKFEQIRILIKFEIIQISTKIGTEEISKLKKNQNWKKFKAEQKNQKPYFQRE